ncbi:MAG TPA: acetyl-CoA acetyltransferase [Acidimicrobiales bacterium]|nr:acetyl-CoA acetyltransferase [Acidimicrobiales bacterium]
MNPDPRAPVIVGVGQSLRRPDEASDLASFPDPATMMADALRSAGEDSGTGDRLLRAADSVRVVDTLSWHYPNPAAAIASALGADPGETVRSVPGGNGPQLLVNDAAEAIAAGRMDVALVAGAEAIQTRLLARQAGPEGSRLRLSWAQQAPDTPGPRQVGHDRPGVSDAEAARSLALPVQVYPVFENALRAAAGEGVDEHQVRVSQLWSRFSAVAARNPYAWSPTERSAEEIRTPSSNNRMIGFPYPKLMNANIQTDQAAALVLCSVEAARAAGVPPDRWVFVWSGSEAEDHWFVSERADLHSSPAIRLAGRTVLDLAGIGIDDIAHVDLYSCFPSAVQIAAAELGLGLDEPGRPLTVTGGLTFAGGPGNNYATHAIAAMVVRLRATPGSHGLVTALGWFATKHAMGVYSTTPMSGGFRRGSPQADVDALPRRSTAPDHEGPVRVESYTVMHERDGSPSLGIVACLLPDGRRAWGNVTDPVLLKDMTHEEQCGRPAVLRSGGALELG